MKKIAIAVVAAVVCIAVVYLILTLQNSSGWKHVPLAAVFLL